MTNDPMTRAPASSFWLWSFGFPRASPRRYTPQCCCGLCRSAFPYCISAICRPQLTCLRTMSFFTTDVPCPSCGYNLRGLTLGRGCPECGLKVTSDELASDDKTRMHRIEAEVEENLRRIEEERARQEGIAALLIAWERRGERFDRLLERIERLVERWERARAE